MARRGRREDHISDGIGVIHFSRWRHFIDYLCKDMLDYDKYIWRGHRNDSWVLEPTLDRLIRKAKIAPTKRPAFRISHLQQFTFAVRGRRGTNPPQITHDNEWWALGQHHGLATPLLDWTSSPFAAAYFAFISTGDDQTRNRAIYGLSQPAVQHKVAALLRAEKAARLAKKTAAEKPAIRNVLASGLFDLPPRPQVEFIRPRSDENQRLVNQCGLFTRAPDGVTLEDWVRTNFKGESKSYVLLKALIPNRDRHECLKVLNRMNINHLTLFPDLYGASRFCNLFGEIEKY